ncbi:hypothetical protein C4J94_1019 [Pseudomonas sp. R5-89-07]|nr:hypothetical protein C4J94_1019 [Pseudomonas sp. R5-89-07]
MVELAPALEAVEATVLLSYANAIEPTATSNTAVSRIWSNMYG